MKGTLPLALALFSFSGSLLAAESLCQQKEQDIRHEIDMAQKNNNPRRVNGLERALTEVRASCTDKKLEAAHLERINTQKQKVAEREDELKQERQDGNDKEKIAKREQKLEEARQELKKLQAEPY
ncbi:DUF1090 domain-containing protein [Pantoea sp. LMR881]|uniref:DUF1090 domain-containing protein n=1 Tax=Pantoea sp. LMR881 TaxID=3014336 RepID=UPI0022AEB671|nr:DUF1090 domain-containing protein [Pantoea sp. LMR881]MCZ4060135.1 DUF1090 domain-containing protein [Pantoea sp. LMR881]